MVFYLKKLSHWGRWWYQIYCQNWSAKSRRSRVERMFTSANKCQLALPFFQGPFVPYSENLKKNILILKKKNIGNSTLLWLVWEIPFHIFGHTYAKPLHNFVDVSTLLHTFVYFWIFGLCFPHCFHTFFLLGHTFFYYCCQYSL